MFLLVDEGTVRQYKADLTDEIEPQINELLERAEKGVKALQRKESLLQTKVSFFTYAKPVLVATYNAYRLRQPKWHSPGLHEH